MQGTDVGFWAFPHGLSPVKSGSPSRPRDPAPCLDEPPAKRQCLGDSRTRLHANSMDPRRPMWTDLVDSFDWSETQNADYCRSEWLSFLELEQLSYNEAQEALEEAHGNGPLGDTPLLWAASDGRTQLVSILLEQNADPNYQPRGREDLNSLVAADCSFSFRRLSRILVLWSVDITPLLKSISHYPDHSLTVQWCATDDLRQLREQQMLESLQQAFVQRSESQKLAFLCGLDSNLGHNSPILNCLKKDSLYSRDVIKLLLSILDVYWTTEPYFTALKDGKQFPGCALTPCL